MQNKPIPTTHINIKAKDLFFLKNYLWIVSIAGSFRVSLVIDFGTG